MATLSGHKSINVYQQGDDPDIPPLVKNPYPFITSSAPITLAPCEFDDDMSPLVENPYSFHFMSPRPSSEPSHSCSFDDEMPPLVEAPAPFFDASGGKGLSPPMINAAYSFYPTQNDFSSPNFPQAPIQPSMFIYSPNEQYTDSANCFEKKLNFGLVPSSVPLTSYDPLASSSTILYEKEPSASYPENKQAMISSSVTPASSSSSPVEDSHPIVFESYQFDFPPPPPAGCIDKSSIASSSSQPAHEHASVPAPRISHSKKRDASYIPRPPNAFILFRSAFVKGDYVGAEVEGNHSALSKIVGKYWKTLSREEKETWEAKAQVAQAEHRRRYPDWRFQPSTNALANANASTGGGKRSVGSRWKKSKLKKEDGKKDGQTKSKGHGNELDGGDEEDEKRKIREESNTSVGKEDSSALDARCAKIADLLVEGKTGHELELALREWEVNQAHAKLGRATDRHQDIDDPSVSTKSSLSPGLQSVLDTPSSRPHTGPVRRNRTQRRITRDHNVPYHTSPARLSAARVPPIQRSTENTSSSTLVSSSPIPDNGVPLTSMFKRPSSPLYVAHSTVVETKSTGDAGEIGGSGADSGHCGPQHFSFSDCIDHVAIPAQRFEWTNVPQSPTKASHLLGPSPTANTATLLLSHGSCNSDDVYPSKFNFYAASMWNGGHYSAYTYDQRPLSDSY